MSEESLITRIIEKLRSDTGPGSLVALTGHTSSDIRIARDKPPIKGKTPFLGVEIFSSIPIMGADVTGIQKSRVLFIIYSRDELTSIKIADRLESLLHPPDNVYYLNFSGVNVSNKMTLFRGRGGRVFDEENDVWVEVVDAEVIWSSDTCP